MKASWITRTVTLVLPALVAQACSVAAANTIVFNNLAASTPYYYNFGNSTGNAVGGYSTSATTFTPSVSGPLDELTLGLFYLFGSNSVTLQLSPSVSGLPSAPIWTTTSAPAPAYGSLMSLTGIGGPVINAGQQYWLEAIAPVTPSTLDAWYRNNQGDVGPIIANGNYIASDDRLALRVGVLGSVPEPCTCMLLCFGLIGATSIRRRPRTQN
jgi:hypothetical protein